MIVKGSERDLKSLAARSIVLAAFFVSLAGCSTGLDPDKVSVTGGWVLQSELGVVDFHFFLEEVAGGSISGNWSVPSQFSFNSLSGRRTALSVELTGDSPNIFPMQLTATLVNKRRMEGYLYFGGKTEKIILVREVITPTLQ